MGTFRVEIQAVGNHGCQRELKNGSVVTQRCTDPSCVDCITREYVGKLQAAGAFFTTGSTDPRFNNYAKLTHWPGCHPTVQDDLLTGTRTGSF